MIVKLNQITKGWAEYHHCVCAKNTFAHRLQTLGDAVEMGKKKTSAEMQQMGEKQVLAFEMWKTVVI